MPVSSKVDLSATHVTTAQPPCFLETTERKAEGTSGPLVARVIGLICGLAALAVGGYGLSAECLCSQQLVLYGGNGSDPCSNGGRSSRHA